MCEPLHPVIHACEKNCVAASLRPYDNGAMETAYPVLSGRHVRLEPLERRHIPGLVAAAGGDPELYRWSPVPQSEAEAIRYVDTAIAAREAGTAQPYANVRLSDDMVIGSTRFFDLERWAWPQGHVHHGRSTPTACEIGYTWLSPQAVRTAANTEAKLLMLAYAFETWKVLRVCLHSDARNTRSRAAMERMGAKFEGILRSHRMAADHIARDSARYSIVATEWPAVMQQLTALLSRT